MRLLVSVFAAAFVSFAGLAAAQDGAAVDIAKLMAPGTLPDNILGETSAPVTIIEYASLTCPHCGRFYRDTFPELKTRYIDTGKVRFILREYPLDQLALIGATVARCDPEGRYFDIMHTLYGEQDVWVGVEQPGAAFLKLMEPYGFTDEKIRACISDEKLVGGIIEIAQQGQELGVAGTPTFFINGVPRSGEIKIDALAAIIDPIIAAGGAPAVSPPASE